MVYLHCSGMSSISFNRGHNHTDYYDYSYMVYVCSNTPATRLSLVKRRMWDLCTMSIVHTEPTMIRQALTSVQSICSEELKIPLHCLDQRLSLCWPTSLD